MSVRLSLLHLVALLSLPLVGLPAIGCTGAAPAATPPRFLCDDPGPITVAGKDTGYTFCTNGPVHRREVRSCPFELPPASACADGGIFGGCGTTADCKGDPHAFCLSSGQKGVCTCSDGCVDDADCGAGSICVCANPVGRCAPARCTSDADCDAGLLCTQLALNPGCGDIAFACQTPEDRCTSDFDCEDNTFCSLRSGIRVCNPPTCVN